jgi:hypothetical protein
VDDEGPWRDPALLAAAGLLPSRPAPPGLAPARSLHARMAAAVARGHVFGLEPSIMVAAESPTAGGAPAGCVWHSLPPTPTSVRAGRHTSGAGRRSSASGRRSSCSGVPPPAAAAAAAAAPAPASAAPAAAAAAGPAKTPVRPSPFACPQQHLATLSAIHGGAAPPAAPPPPRTGPATPPPPPPGPAPPEVPDVRPPYLARLRIRKGQPAPEPAAPAPAPPPPAAPAAAPAAAERQASAPLTPAGSDATYATALSQLGSGQLSGLWSGELGDTASSSTGAARTPTRRGAAGAWHSAGGGGGSGSVGALSGALGSAYLTPHGSLAPPAMALARRSEQAPPPPQPPQPQLQGPPALPAEEQEQQQHNVSFGGWKGAHAPRVEVRVSAVGQDAKAAAPPSTRALGPFCGLLPLRRRGGAAAAKGGAPGKGCTPGTGAAPPAAAAAPSKLLRGLRGSGGGRAPSALRSFSFRVGPAAFPVSDSGSSVASSVGRAAASSPARSTASSRRGGGGRSSGSAAGSSPSARVVRWWRARLSTHGSGSSHRSRGSQRAVTPPAAGAAVTAVV